MILIVTYDLRGAGDYAPFYETLKAQGTWWHYITSTWLLSTSKTPGEVFQALAPHMDESDYVLVAEMGLQHNGWLPAKAWEWIRQQQRAEALRNSTPLPPQPMPSASLSDMVRERMLSTPLPPQPMPSASLSDMVREHILRSKSQRSLADLLQPRGGHPAKKRRSPTSS